MNEGQLIETLLERGVPKNALKNNLKANLINEKLLQRIIRPKIIINNDEVNNEYKNLIMNEGKTCLLYTSPSPRDPKTPRMPSSA